MLAYNYDTNWNRFKNGDVQAFECIYRNHINSLISYGLKITSDLALVKDCIQDLFIELWRSRQNLAPTTDPKFYLFKALRNKLSKTLSSQSFVNSTEMKLSSDNLVTKYVELEIISQEIEFQTNKKLHTLLTRLPERQQEAIYLRFYHNFPYEAIASMMNMNYQSVLNLMQRALKTLRKAYLSSTTQFG